MPEFDQHGYQGYWLPARRLDGDHGIVVVIKRRFAVDVPSATCGPADDTAPVRFACEYHDDDDPPNVSVKAAAEVAIEKTNVDIIIHGTAYAPNGKPVPSFDCGVRIPNVIERRLRIFGERTCEWFPPLKELTYKDLAEGEEWEWLDPDFSDPQPIAKLPLRYEFAYGGWGVLVLTEDEQEMAEESQAVNEMLEERRARKKEIEQELIAEEEAKEAAAKEAKAPKKGGITDEKAQELADKAFADDGAERGHDGVTRVIDASIIARLAAEEGDDLDIASPLRLGQNLPDVPEDTAVADDEEQAAEEADGAEEEEPEEEDERFTGNKTQMLDISKLNLEDELSQDLHEASVERQAALKDEEGTLRDRDARFGDIKLYGDDWAAQYVGKRKKTKKKREESEFPELPCPSNPSGMGFAVSYRQQALEGLKLPHIEDPDNLITPEELVVDLAEMELMALRAPAGFAPYAPGWFPRAGYWGIYPWDEEAAAAAVEKAKEEFDPEDHDDLPILEQLEKLEIPVMRTPAFQEAHPKMQVADVRGDEDVYLENLTPDGMLFFRLPGLHPTATIDMSEGPVPLRLRLDTLVFDLDDVEAPAVELAWRAWHPIADFDQLSETPFRKINIIEVDQEGWLDVKRDEQRADKGGSSDGVTQFIAAITDEELEELDDAEGKYKAQFKKLRKDQDPGVGVRIDDKGDAVVFDQDEGRRLSDDVWDDNIRDAKDDVEEMARRIKEEKDKARLKDVRALARAKADEEFGIIRDDDGEILVSDLDELE